MPTASTIMTTINLEGARFELAGGLVVTCGLLLVLLPALASGADAAVQGGMAWARSHSVASGVCTQNLEVRKDACNKVWLSLPPLS